jgi:hypothetical protein
MKEKKTRDIKECMRKYAVEAASIEDFVQRYKRSAAFAQRDKEYQKASIQSHYEDIQKYGYTLISHHDSNTGEVVTWYPPLVPASPKRTRKSA